jgi:hypothetical protein
MQEIISDSLKSVIRLGDNTALSSINEATDFTCVQSVTHLENVTSF